MLCILIWLLGFGYSWKHSTGLKARSPSVAIGVGVSKQLRIWGRRVRRKKPPREAVAPCSPQDLAVGCSWPQLLSAATLVLSLTASITVSAFLAIAVRGYLSLCGSARCCVERGAHPHREVP